MTSLLVNAGCGPRQGGHLPRLFAGWRQFGVDLDPSVNPDLVADITDLSAIADGTAQAVWAAHCLEHLRRHQVGTALAEFRRILSDEGFLCLIVPDLQAVATSIAADKLHDVLYMSAAGPITADDIVYGHGPAIARGREAMAHRCGFTPTVMQRHLLDAGYVEFVLRRRHAFLELAVVARKKPWADDAERDNLLELLQL